MWCFWRFCKRCRAVCCLLPACMALSCMYYVGQSWCCTVGEVLSLSLVFERAMGSRGPGIGLELYAMWWAVCTGAVAAMGTVRQCNGAMHFAAWDPPQGCVWVCYRALNSGVGCCWPSNRWVGLGLLLAAASARRGSSTQGATWMRASTHCNGLMVEHGHAKKFCLCLCSVL